MRPRIIPARAGPTDRSECISTMRSDHPRSCGANGHAGRHGRRLAGSSPLVRGQPDGAGDASRQTRIIPARAGPTASLMLAKVEGTDHPRSCGANAYRASDDTGPCGSSPLVRGQRDDTVRPVLGVRIIPARAGPTSPKIVSYDPPDGSSPLVRGQPVRIARRFNATRIIPARAGPTLPVTALSRGSADHPRSCGANQSDVSK